MAIHQKWKEFVALLGYIDKAKKQQDILRAKNCLTAAQTELVSLYAKGTPLQSYIKNSKTETNSESGKVVDMIFKKDSPAYFDGCG